jgi:uncharacterized membrane protein
MSTVIEEEEKETGRVEAFSDGVFAIAITLLVLEIPVTHPGTVPHGKHLADVVLQQGPNFAAYLVSFVTILVMWLNHHSIFQMVRRIDRLFLVLNGFLLLLVTFINYPTALVANFIATDDERFAAAFCAGTFVIIAVIYNLLWRRAARGMRLIGKRVTAEQVARMTRQYQFGPILYLLTFALAFVNAWASLALNGALALYFAFTGQIERTA